MTMFNITDGKNNISRDKPVEHIDLVIGLHVSACTSCTRPWRRVNAERRVLGHVVHCCASHVHMTGQARSNGPDHNVPGEGGWVRKRRKRPCRA